MASPLGYITGEVVDQITRTWARARLQYDASLPPWTGPGQLASTTFEILASTNGPSGPWNDAHITQSLTGPCSPLSPNPVPVNGATETVFGIGGPGFGVPDTEYWFRVIIRDGVTVLEDYVVPQSFRTDAYPVTLCLSPTNITTVSADVHMAQSSGEFAVNAPCDQDTAVWEIAPNASGPWTTSPAEPVVDFTPDHTFAGLTPDTQYYYRARFRDGQGFEYLVTEPCTFRTLADANVPPPFNPLPCPPGGGAGPDVENTILCDLDAQGNLLGTALAVYEYDSSGNPVGAPTFIDPVTGDPYVAQGTLQVCPDAACLAPVQFCFTASSTGPVEHPGRMYDITLPLNQGFAVQSLQVDAVTSPANIVWEVDDPDGEAFRVALTSFMEGRLPADAVVTITNPNAGGGQVCGAAQAFQIHIECLRLDQSPPNLIELVYNAGQDMVINPAYNENPPLSPPVSQGNYGYHLLSRQDDPGPFPGNPPANDVLCTSVANRGWETNDVGRTFEIWGQDVAGGVTPTPRGTPVQEITSDGPPPGGRSTIWQTFQAPASGNFTIRVVHGARDAGEQHRITLTPGDTDATQGPGAIIDNTTTPPSVYGNPWTQFSQSIPLVNGQVYTLALSTTNPAGGARGGLFTDMRAFLDVPDQRATATTDDDTCTVTVDETSTATTCQQWQPQCIGGTIAGWQRVDTGETMTNAQFWAQTPAPQCCLPEAAESGGGSTVANLIHSYLICGEVGGIRQTMVRYVITDASGGILASQIIGADGAPASPTSWQPGGCGGAQFMGDQVLCDAGAFDTGGRTVQFLRKFLQGVNSTGFPTVVSHSDFTMDGAPYTVVGDARLCEQTQDHETVCWVQDSTGTQIHTGTIFWDTKFEQVPGGPGWILLDQNQNTVLSTEPGLTFVPCGEATDPIATTGLCLSDGTPIAVVTRRNHLTGAVTEDGWINLLTGAFSAGVPPVGTVSCSSSQSIQVSGTFCSVDDATNDVLALVLIEYHYAADGSIDSVRLVDATTGATYVPPAGSSITVCPTGGEQSADRDITVLCDFNGGVATPFVRDYQRNNLGQITGHTDYTLANAPYTPTGTVGFCTPNTRDAESEILCDVNGGVSTPFMRTQVRDTSGVIVTSLDQTLAGAPYTPTGTVGICSATVPVRDSEMTVLCDANGTRFIQTRVMNELGVVVTTVNTTLAGGAFAPVGAVSVCAQTVQADTDFVEEVLCDANGTSFIRLFRFNSTTGALVSTTNTTLAGAAFTPVGTVGLCSDCCPAVIGNGCTNTGSGFYTAIRAGNGTISLIDSVTGAAVLAGNIVACPSDNTTRTLTAQARVLTNASPWTPGGDVAGTLTSLTVTGTAGLWDMVDANGTALTGLPAGLTLTWSAEDDNTLTGPTSVTPQAGATVVANWTQR